MPAMPHMGQCLATDQRTSGSCRRSARRQDQVGTKRQWDSGSHGVDEYGRWLAQPVAARDPAAFLAESGFSGRKKPRVRVGRVEANGIVFEIKRHPWVKEELAQVCATTGDGVVNLPPPGRFRSDS